MVDDQPSISILGTEIPTFQENLHINELKYYDKNPRVYSCIYGIGDSIDKEELQELIHEKMKQEPSVKNLLPQIRKHGGLIDPILVRYDTKEVIEGNSRLAAYKILSQKDPEKWSKIKCLIVSKLTEEQQDAYLNEIHVRGKTQWTPYEKANFAYVRFKDGLSIDQIANRFSVSENEIKKRIDTIKLMDSNSDNERSKFSHYDVLIRNRAISAARADNEYFNNFILAEIKKPEGPDSPHPRLEAKEIRDKLPTVINKPRVLKKLLSGKLSLDDAYQNAESSGPKKLITGAFDKVASISKEDIQKLEKSEFSALKIEWKRLKKKIDRVNSIIQKVEEEMTNG